MHASSQSWRCLCCYALWLGCQLLSLTSEPRGRLPRNTDHLGQRCSFEPFSGIFSPSASFLSSAPLFPSEVDNKDILGVLLDVRPLLIFFPYVFCTLVLRYFHIPLAQYLHSRRQSRGESFMLARALQKEPIIRQCFCFVTLARLIRYQG